MNFNTSNSTFRQLLGNGLSYRVPPFQRDYSWTEEEWEDLWQDMVNLLAPDGESAHYMGYLVLQSSDSKQFAIIDGQQRLTTLSVLVLASLSLLQDMSAAGADAENNRIRAEQLRNSYIGYLDPVSLVPRSKLALNRHNNRFYQTYLVPLGKMPQRGLNASEHKLRKAFIWFKERVKKHCGTTEASGRKLAEFVETLADKLFFTVSYEPLSQKRTKQNNRACKQQESQEIISMTLISDNQSPEVLQPGEKPPAFPAALTPPQLSAILSFLLRAVAAMWCNHLNAVLFQKIIIEFVTVISFIANEFFRLSGKKKAVKCCCRELHFMSRSIYKARRRQEDRKKHP